MNESDQIEERLGYRFQDRALLERALTHKSAALDPMDPRAHNEVLEFLGDAVLELAITDYLYRAWGETTSEGVLTRRRARLINSRVLAKVGERLELFRWIRARSETTAPDRFHRQLMADTLEALIGAIYLDSDFPTAGAWILRVMTPELQDLSRGRAVWMDYRSLLQEYIQGETRRLPEFHVEDVSGPDHEKVFTLAVYYAGEKLGTGRGRTKKEAAQTASRSALTRLRQEAFRRRLGLQNPPPPLPDGPVEDSDPLNVPADERPSPG